MSLPVACSCRRKAVQAHPVVLQCWASVCLRALYSTRSLRASLQEVRV